MSIRDYQRILVLGGSLFLAICLFQALYTQRSYFLPQPYALGDKTSHVGAEQDVVGDNSHPQPSPDTTSTAPFTVATILPDPDTNDKPPASSTYDPSLTHRILYSRTTASREYFGINTRDHTTYNANIIPHPTKNDTWIVVAQKAMRGAAFRISELWCDAVFRNEELYCVQNPLTLTIQVYPGDQCKGEFAVVGSILGPHDARAFYTPDFPLTTYTMNSHKTCKGQWAADLRPLMDWVDVPGENVSKDHFRWPTELERPPPYHVMEKNYFLFWSNTGDVYTHWNVMPRSFGHISWNGTAGPDLAHLSHENDDKCMSKYMPKVPAVDTFTAEEALHQATNSLAVTMCKRGECDPEDPENTLIMTIFHHKVNKVRHPVYEPIPMLFASDAPFGIVGIATKPLWIHGRGRPGDPPTYAPRPADESEMVYVTSIAWKNHGMKYHGFLDDEIFVAFGVEDSASGGIDVLASDLLLDIGMCER